ncbi:MAG TPA: trimethylamine methyltransferase family protein [Clostridiales bacterium]|nr:trimethylamine methyltransferase family protein [Clostridiales bacterium]
MKRNFVQKQSVQYQVLNDHQCEAIAENIFGVLERTGCMVRNGKARGMLKEAGCKVEGERVWLPRALVEWAVRSCPSSITMYDRFAKPAFTLAPHQANFGPTNSDTFVYDMTTDEKRRATLEDAKKYAILCDNLPNMDWASTLVMISDLDDRLADLYELNTALRLTSKPIMNFSFAPDNLREMIEMCEVIAGGADSLALHPFIMTMICPIDPLQHSEGGLDQIMYMAGKNLPYLYVPGMSLGLSSPTTFAGSISLGMADAFVGLVVGQLTKKGSPFISCNYTDNINPRTVTITYSHPEYQLVTAASADVYRYLGIPFSTNCGASSSGIFDEEYVFECTTSLHNALLSGTNMGFAIGSTECGRSSSPEALVFCDEALGFLKRTVEGIEISEYTLAADLIDKVGPGGNFLAEETTVKELRGFWKSDVIVDMPYDQRKTEKYPDMKERLHAKVEEIVAKGPRYPLAADLEAKLDAIVKEAEARVRKMKEANK